MGRGLTVFDQVKEELSSVRSNFKYKGIRRCFKELAEEDFDFDIPPELLRKNIGRGKVFPGGPVCEFNGKNIPTFVTNSDSGGITPDILVEVLKHLDKCGISD